MIKFDKDRNDLVSQLEIEAFDEMLRPKVRFADNKSIKHIQHIIDGNTRLKAQN